MQHVADIIPIMRHQPQISHPTAKFREDISFKLLNVLYLVRKWEKNSVIQRWLSFAAACCSRCLLHSERLLSLVWAAGLYVVGPWLSGNRQQAYGYNTLILVTVAVAVVFNGGTRGCNLAYAWQESATANEKAIWEELAYWHQAWRQEKAVRSETPNDGSSWTAAHYSKSFFLSLINVTVLRYLMFFSLHLLH